MQIAGNCYGFSDVALTDSFCNAVEWLGNRGVTLGCALGQYCPANNVTRAQMALFMNRLGNVLTPTVLEKQEVFNFEDFLTPKYGCETTLSAASYPRIATQIATMTLSPPSAATKEICAFPVFSTDGGATWTGWSANDNFCQTTQVGIAGSLTSVSSILPLTPGVAYNFAIGLYDNKSVLALMALNCAALVRVDGVTGSSAPFDEPAFYAPGPAPVPMRR